MACKMQKIADKNVIQIELKRTSQPLKYSNFLDNANFIFLGTELQCSSTFLTELKVNTKFYHILPIFTYLQFLFNSFLVLGSSVRKNRNTTDYIEI
ncbi:hypothetical protein BpHYR1_033527 [Brachionus plicatilis]|uniref:Uncharacterized protein n=1 Tax=Brachionus plicatilis TaxID=10195 RepID=A0A3M7SG58_BRAPC|nr:hypothetical protein BpHYR1_033527 [Brachionus plicatilis]